MLRAVPIALLCSLFLIPQIQAQDVVVPRQLRKLSVIRPDPDQGDGQASKSVPAGPVVITHTQNSSTSEPEKKSPRDLAPNSTSEKVTVQSTKSEPEKVVATKDSANLQTEKTDEAKREVVKSSPAKETAANSRSVKSESIKTEVEKAPVINEAKRNLQVDKGRIAKTESTKQAKTALSAGSEKRESAKAESKSVAAAKPPAVSVTTETTQKVRLDLKPSGAQGPTLNVQVLSDPMETASTKLADGFDFPVGKPDGEGYYKARGYRSGGHMGEDWDGVRGGDTDLGDPIYNIGDGIVVFARDVHLGWGNVVIVRHAYKEDGIVKHIDSLYGHLNSILVRRGQRVARGQEIGTMGTAHGRYDAHLHLEIRKNLEIGMSKSKFEKNLTNYFDPSQFISSHRHLSGGGASFRVAMNTFTHDSAYHFDTAPNFAPRRHSTLQSAAALRRAVSNGSTADRD